MRYTRIYPHTNFKVYAILKDIIRCFLKLVWGYMHGLDIVKDLVDRVKKEAGKQDIKNISKIYIDLGNKSGIDAEELTLCFKILAEDILLEIKTTDSNQIRIDTIEGE